MRTAEQRAASAAYARAAYKRNPAKAKAAHQRWLKTHPEYGAGYYLRHKEKVTARNKRWRATHPGAHRQATRARKYGLSGEAFAALLSAQGHLCAVCAVPLADDRRTHVDHDHVSGQVRGLLCGPCNQGLGLFADSTVRLQLAISYLNHSAVTAV